MSLQAYPTTPQNLYRKWGGGGLSTGWVFLRWYSLSPEKYNSSLIEIMHPSSSLSSFWQSYCKQRTSISAYSRARVAGRLGPELGRGFRA
jgi:hypothetical protein